MSEMVNELLYSDDDEEIIEYLSTDFFNRHVAERCDHYTNLRDKSFHRRFRLQKETVVALLENIRSRLESTKCGALSPMTQLLCALRFYATGSQLITCGDFVGVHESTACRIVHKVTDTIARLYPQFVHMPSDDSLMKEAAVKFYEIARFPRVIGAIDCTHVRIKSPGGEHAEIYRNRKGYFSINTQAICSADLMFRDVVARWHGSAHDSHIWDHCNQRRYFLQGAYKNYCLLGDSGYAQTTFMMTPLGTVTSAAESLYNESQIRTRNTVERTFGIWKRRFPILSRGIQIHLSRVPGIIVATSVLHNVARLQNDPDPVIDEDYPPISDSITEGNENQTVENPTRLSPGKRARRALIDQHFGRLRSLE